MISISMSSSLSPVSDANFPLSLLENCKSLLGTSASEDQTLVLAGLAFSLSSDELERSLSLGHGHSRKTPCPMDVNS